MLFPCGTLNVVPGGSYRSASSLEVIRGSKSQHDMGEATAEVSDEEDMACMKESGTAGCRSRG